MDAFTEAREHLPFFVVWGTTILYPLLVLALCLPPVLVVDRRVRPPPDSEDLHWSERARLRWSGAVRLWSAILVGVAGAAGGGVLLSGPLTPVAGAGPALAGAGVFSALAFGLVTRQRRRWVPWLDPRTVRRGRIGFLLILWFPVLPAGLGLLVLPGEPGPAFWIAFLPLLALLGFSGIGGGVFVARAIGLARPAEEDVRAAVEAAARRVGRAPPRRILVAELGMSNAFAIPWLDTVVFSTRAAEVLGADELRVVAAHELGHLAEPLRDRLRRTLGLVFWLALMTGRLLHAWLGWEGLFLILAGSFLLRRWAKLAARSLETRADAYATEGENDGPVYASALEALYRDNLTPAVLGRRSVTHPDLYDRMEALGVPPDFPRPDPPARSADGRALTFAALIVLLLATALGPSILADRRPRTEADALRALAARGGERGAGAFAVLGEARLARDDAPAAVAFLRAAVDLDPWSPRLASRLGVALSRTGDEAGASEEFRRAERLAAAEEWRDR